MRVVLMCAFFQPERHVRSASRTCPGGTAAWLLLRSVEGRKPWAPPWHHPLTPKFQAETMASSYWSSDEGPSNDEGVALEAGAMRTPTAHKSPNSKAFWSFWRPTTRSSRWKLS
jgi:hypothetical protein